MAQDIHNKKQKGWGFSALIVSLPQEARNDALYFIEQAEALPDHGALFARWRCLRAAVLFTVVYAEAFINQWSRDVSELRRDKLTPEIYELVRKETGSRHTLTLEEKFAQLPKHLLGTGINTESTGFKSMRKVIWIRNSLAHYEHSKDSKVIYGKKITSIKIREYLAGVDEVIQSIYDLSADPAPPGYSIMHYVPYSG